MQLKIFEDELPVSLLVYNLTSTILQVPWEYSYSFHNPYINLKKFPTAQYLGSYALLKTKAIISLNTYSHRTLVT